MPNTSGFNWDDYRPPVDPGFAADHANTSPPPTGNPSRGGAAGASGFRYAEPNTQPADIAASLKGFEYEQVFMDMLNQFGGYQNRAFDAWENSVSETGAIDWDKISEITTKIGSSASGAYFGGDAGMEGTYQSQIQKAMQGMGQSGFGAGGGGMLENAMLNSAKQGGQIFSNTFDRNLGVIGGIQQQDLASQRQTTLAGLENFTGAMLGAGESAFSSAAWAAELPYQRSLSRYDSSFQRELEPYIKLALTPTPWYEQQAQNIGARALNYGFDEWGRELINQGVDWAGEAIDWGIDQLGFGGGGDNDGGGGNNEGFDDGTFNSGYRERQPSDPFHRGSSGSRGW